MSEAGEPALLDTSVVIDLPALPESAIPPLATISAITLAELAAGPHASSDPDERARRQMRLQWVEAVFDPLPFDAAAARCFGAITALVRASGRVPRRRMADLQIAAVAMAHDLALHTRNPDDLAGLDSVVRVVGV